MFSGHKKKMYPMHQSSGERPPCNGPGLFQKTSVSYCKLCGKEILSQDCARKPGSCDVCWRDFLRYGQNVPEPLASIGNRYTADFDCYAEFTVYTRLYFDGELSQEELDAKVAAMIDKYSGGQAKCDAGQTANTQKQSAAKQRLRNMYGI